MKRKSGLSDSPFFQQPSPPPKAERSSGSKSSSSKSKSRAKTKSKSKAKSKAGGDRTPVRPNARTPERANDRTVSSERSTKRHSFEIYEDQLASLKELKLQSILSNREKSMSEMVREALDRYLEQHQ